MTTATTTKTTTKTVEAAAAAKAATAKTKARLLEGGANAIAEQGFHAVTMESIGAASGFSHQTVRDHFRSPTLLLTDIVSLGWHAVRVAMPTDAEPIEKILAAYDALVLLVHEKPSVARCMLHDALSAGVRNQPLDVTEFSEFRADIDRAIGSEIKNRAIAAAYTDIVISAMTHLVYPRGVLFPPVGREVLTQILTFLLLSRWTAGGRLVTGS